MAGVSLHSIECTASLVHCYKLYPSHLISINFRPLLKSIPWAMQIGLDCRSLFGMNIAFGCVEIKKIPTHVLHPYLPDETHIPYKLRTRSHRMTLINNSSITLTSSFGCCTNIRTSDCIVQCLFLFFFVFTVTMSLSLFLLNEHDDDDDDGCIIKRNRLDSLAHGGSCGTGHRILKTWKVQYYSCKKSARQNSH